MRSGRLQQDL